MARKTVRYYAAVHGQVIRYRSSSHVVCRGLRMGRYGMEITASEKNSVARVIRISKATYQTLEKHGVDWYRATGGYVEGGWVYAYGALLDLLPGTTQYALGRTF